MNIPAGLDAAKAHLVAQWPVGGPIVCCRFDPKGRFVYCGIEGPTVHRVALADGKKTPLPGGHDSWVFSMAVAPGGETIYSGGGDGRVVCWDVGSQAPRILRTIEAHRGWVRALAVARDGRSVASGGNDRAVRIWEASTGRLVREMTGHEGQVYSLAFHPDGKTLLSGDLLGSVRQWDLETGRELGSFEAKPLHHRDKSQLVDYGGVRGLCVSADGATVAAGGLHKATNPLGAVNEPLVLIFDARTRKATRTLTAEAIAGGVIWGLRYLADGSLAGASGGTSGGSVLFWKPGADKSHHRLKLPNSARDLDIHPDGLRLATAHHDGTVRIARLATGEK